MNDPYKVLNVPNTATDDEVKRAYRELARKYHPDNYHDNPLADLAQEKMKEINEAYEEIQKQRRSGGTAAQQYDASYGTFYSGTYSGTQENMPIMQRIRFAIERGNISLAERLLNSVSEHTAEWNYLKGCVCFRRGWFDEAKRYFETACQMEPNNDEYRNALESFTSGGYRPSGYSSVSTCGGDGLSNWCLALLCCNLLGGGSGFYFCC